MKRIIILIAMMETGSQILAQNRIPGPRDFPRRDYVLRQRQKGRKVFGVFPAQYPREILWAMNILPVEIWDPPVAVGSSAGHLQTYICSVVRLGLELILQGACDDLDGFLFPHTCDSIQNMASMVHDYLAVEKPCTFFYHPKAPYWTAAGTYYTEALKGLVKNLETAFGPLDPSELKRSVRRGREITLRMNRLYELRAQGRLDITSREFYDFIRLLEFLHPDDFVPMLQEILVRRVRDPVKGTPVILSGVLPNPREVLDLLDEAGVCVADDDLLSCSRRIPSRPSDNPEPFEALTEDYFHMPPCSTKDSPVRERLEHLLHKIERSRAGGVIFYTVKFCEPELFDIPLLVQGLKARGILTLTLDVELNQGLSGQMRTRVEAFIEMLD